jgi:hypothetical protein
MLNAMGSTPSEVAHAEPLVTALLFWSEGPSPALLCRLRDRKMLSHC